MKFKPFSSDQFKIVLTKIDPSADIRKGSISLCTIMHIQGSNHDGNLGATSPMVGKICPPGWNRVKVSENLGATPVALVAPVDTSLHISSRVTSI